MLIFISFPCTRLHIYQTKTKIHFHNEAFQKSPITISHFDEHITVVAQSR